MGFKGNDEFPLTSSLYLLIPLLRKNGHVIDAKKGFRL